MRPMPELEVRTVKVADLEPYSANVKLHPRDQIEQIAASIEEFGNCDPIGVWHNGDGEMVVVEGHGRLSALKLLGRDECQVIFLDHLSDAQRRAYGLTHNQLAINTGFDPDVLMDELGKITESDMGFYGFGTLMTSEEVDELLMPDGGERKHLLTRNVDKASTRAVEEARRRSHEAYGRIDPTCGADDGRESRRACCVLAERGRR